MHLIYVSTVLDLVLTQPIKYSACAYKSICTYKSNMAPKRKMPLIISAIIPSLRNTNFEGDKIAFKRSFDKQNLTLVIISYYLSIKMI